MFALATLFLILVALITQETVAARTPLSSRQNGGTAISAGGTRQNAPGNLGQALAAQAAGKLGTFMGEPQATEAMIALARTMGATRNSAGSIGTMSKGFSSMAPDHCCGIKCQQQAEGYGLVPVPAGAVPRRVSVTSRSRAAWAKSVKIRYGPYKVPSASVKSPMGLYGMLNSYPHTNMEKPCTGSCTITGMEAGLEYFNGTNANINTGLWLHHMALFNSGPGRDDPPCSHRDVSLPHATIGGTPRNSERIFASGNERSRASFSDWGVNDAGYKIRPTDRFAALIEPMNENSFDVTVWMTMTYDYVDGHPYKDDVKTIWFDVRQCGTSEINPPRGQRRFVLDYQWKASIDGEVIGSIEHLHGGGARMTITNDGQMACDSTARYGTKPEFVGRGGGSTGGGHSHGGAMKHISDQPVCNAASGTLSSKQMRRGQNWEMKAYYDFDALPGNTHSDGSLDEVMGIAIMYVRRADTASRYS